jgi:hypothetical protein
MNLNETDFTVQHLLMPDDVFAVVCHEADSAAVLDATDSSVCWPSANIRMTVCS